MRIFLIAVLFLTGCAAKAVEQKPEEGGLVITGPGKQLATLDKKTGKLVYADDADPKEVAQVLLEQLARTGQELEACKSPKKKAAK